MRYLRGNFQVAALTVLVLAPLGVVAGFIWSAVAPASRFVVTDVGPMLADPVAQTLIEADGWFAVVTGGFGLLCGIAGYVLARRRPIQALVGLAGGGLLAGYLALLVGGTAKGTIHAAAPGGFTTTASLGVTAHGVLFAWPILATAAFWIIEFVVFSQERREVRGS
ncbi:hypothetical protein ACFHYQ_00990 [Sphaerimonospora cavernae]|uniref:DUF2567 domain-containing protein n=1 Tax=Sphaerimonospora cavernae TaxID=1740611 RepID=A0ABV6TXE0_9ACTN